ARTVMGVLPRGFQFALAGSPDLWLPLVPAPEDAARRYFHWVHVIARLEAGATVASARAGLAPVAAGLQEADPQWHRGVGLTLVPLHDQISGPVRPVLLLTLGAATIVLLVACANLASLLLGRRRAGRRWRSGSRSERPRPDRRHDARTRPAALGGGRRPRAGGVAGRHAVPVRNALWCGAHRPRHRPGGGRGARGG